MENVKELFWAFVKDQDDGSYGWSCFIECFDDETVELFCEDIESEGELYSVMRDCVSIWNDRMENAKIEGGF